VVSQVGYTLRFGKAVTALKQLIDQGQAGRPTLFEGRYWCNFIGPYWWADKSKSNGQVYEQVIHIYDMALYLFGPVESASGYMANLAHQQMPMYTIEDTSASLLRFRNGSLGTVSASNVALPERFIATFRAVFDYVTLDYRSTGDGREKDESTIYWQDGKTINRQENFVEDKDAYLDETLAFLNAVRGEGQQIAPARDGLNGIRLTTAVMESAKANGIPVKIIFQSPGGPGSGSE